MNKTSNLRGMFERARQDSNLIFSTGDAETLRGFGGILNAWTYQLPVAPPDNGNPRRTVVSGDSGGLQ